MSPKKQISWGSYWILIKKRFVGLIIPYLAWNAIYIAIFLIGGLFLTVIASRVAELNLHSFWGIIGAELGIWTRPANGPLWYIRDLFYLSLLAPALVWIARWRRGYLLLCILPLFFGFPLLCNLVFHWCPFNAYELIAYSLGIYLRQQAHTLHWFEKHWKLAITSVVICLINAFGYITWHPLRWIFDAGVEYLVLIPACLFLLKFLSYPPQSLAYKIITKPSFFIFAAHSLCASAVVRLLLPYLPPTSVNGLLFASIYVIGGGAIVYSLYFVLKKTCGNSVQYLTGGR